MTPAIVLLSEGRRARWRRNFALPSRKLAEQDEKRGQKQQRNAAADHPDGNLDRKRICDVDNVAKEVDHFFHVCPPL